MEIKEKVIEKTVKVFELTEEEFENIKIKERKESREDVLEYIKFSIKYYNSERHSRNDTDFVRDLMRFVNGESNIIPNLYRCTFNNFLKEFKNKEW